MSAIGYKRTFSGPPTMSALPPKADIGAVAVDVLTLARVVRAVA